MKSSREFARLRAHGEASVGKFLLISRLVDTTALETSFRAGFITSKRVGMAVVRNKVRRRLRAIVDEAADEIRPGALFVTIARYRAAQASYAALKRDWFRQAKRAGILLPPNESHRSES